MPEKRCPKCRETKPYSAFFKNRARDDGVGVYCAACHTAVAKESLLRLRLSVLDQLGGRVCVRCKIDDIRVLIIDHKNGGGSQHRKDAVSSYSVLRYVEKHPEEFQVLCWNCNHIERLERGESGKAYTERVAAGPPERVTLPPRWARDYDACIDCGETERKHARGGRCTRCSKRAWDREHGVKQREPKADFPT